MKNRFPEEWREKKEIVSDQTINQTTTVAIDNQDLATISQMLQQLTKKDDSIDVTPKAIEAPKDKDLGE